jgi:hypothetical protein
MIRILTGTEVQVFTVQIMILLLTVIAKFLVKISARALSPSMRYFMIYLCPFRIVPYTVLGNDLLQ